ncbi:GDSL lipase/esterase [Dactylonectria macrodidyma]|uniref:GDSL lipase/esterase n=1 Tax=Dactylonectria macrodidyma TaxID=307937 RepID=A0A9P9DYR1_9HYPO|nr:GDSL lipase/esterase [Dactylonectria macrodidyma]
MALRIIINYGIAVLLAFVTLTNATPFGRYSTLFSFGDSYTRTGFNISGTQPSSANPFGNPIFPGPTSANGKNWIQYLTVAYNDSELLTYNFAYSGATVDKSLVPCNVDLTSQVVNRFLPHYTGDKASWNPDRTLFLIWIGINDVIRSYETGNSTEELHPAIFNAYSDLLGQLYGVGARHFILLNVPPLERTPRTLEASDVEERSPLEKAAVQDWNRRLRALSGDLKKRHAGLRATVYNIHGLFNRVLDNPQQFAATSIYKSTSWCTAYKNGTPKPNTKYDACEYAADEYMYRDDLHPTSPVHELVAQKLKTYFNKVHI